MVDLGICSSLPSSGGIEFRQGVRTLTVQASENSHGEQRPSYVLLGVSMAKIPALLFHVPCVRQGSGVFTVSSRVPSRPVYCNITHFLLVPSPRSLFLRHFPIPLCRNAINSVPDHGT